MPIDKDFTPDNPQTSFPVDKYFRDFDFLFNLNRNAKITVKLIDYKKEINNDEQNRVPENMMHCDYPKQTGGHKFVAMNLGFYSCEGIFVTNNPKTSGLTEKN